MRASQKVVQKLAAVSSYAYGPEMFYADKHEQLPLYSQYEEFKKTYRESGGSFAKLTFRTFEDISAIYKGQLSVFSSSKVIVDDFSFGQDFLCAKSSENFALSNKRKSIKVSNALLCLPGGGYNIHHFVLEVLPSILLFREEIRDFGMLILGGFETSTFIDELCTLFFPGIKVVKIPPNTLIHAKKSALINSFPYKIYPQEIIGEIRQTVKDFVVNRKPTPKISANNLLFARGDKERNRRNLVNQEDLLSQCFIKGKKLQVTMPAHQDIFESVGLSIRINTHVGQSGGGFIHTLWGEELTRVIELKPDGFKGNSEIFDLCRLFNRDYRSVTTTSLGGDWRNSSQILEEQEISKLLDLMA